MPNDSGRTPEWLNSYILKIWGKTHDVCPYNPDFDEIINTDTNALKINWISPVYCNPPYSNYKPFLKLGFELWQKHKIISVFLLKTDYLCTSTFQKIKNHCEIRFFNRRLKFGGYGGNTAPFTSCLIIFDGKHPKTFSQIDVPLQKNAH